MEIELKAGLSPADAQALAQRLRERWGPESGPEDLHARYFDSADDRLARAGIALRIRTEGGALVQTVKAARHSVGGFHQVREVEADVTGWTPDRDAIADEALRQAIAKALGGAEAGVRFETCVSRRRWLVRHDHGLIEAALDLGEIRAGQAATPVCEVELELLEGSPEAVFELAQELLGRMPALLTLPSKAARGKALANGKAWRPEVAGGKPAPAQAGEAGEESWGRVLATLAAAIGANLHLLFEQQDPEGPHQLRVALRRLRAALKLHQPLLDREIAKGLGQQARDLGRIVAPLRDCDVLLESLQAGTSARPELMQALALHRAELKKEVGNRLLQAGATRFAIGLLGLASIGGWKRGGSAQTVDDLSARAIRRIWRKARPLGDRLSVLEDEDRHEFRKNLKKLRYLLELSPGNENLKAFTSKLKRLQEELGLLNDIAVLEGWNPPLPPELGAAFAETRAELQKGMVHRADLALGRACRHWRDLRKLALPVP